MVETFLSDPTSIVALVVALLSLLGTIFLAYASIKSSRIKEKSDQIAASDEIASGSSQLLKEYRAEVRRYRAEVADLKLTVSELESWKMDVTEFIIPVLQGAKENERELIKNGIDPPYKLPKLPEWLNV